MRTLLLLAGLYLLLLSACTRHTPPTTKPDFLSASIDSTLRPGDDFYAWAVGRWLKNNPIPETESIWYIGSLVNEELYLRKKNINEKAVQENAAAGTVSRKIADFWLSAMDSTAIDRAGLSVFQPDMDRIRALKNTNELLAMASELIAKGSPVLFNIFVDQDVKNSAFYGYYMYQGGLGMPNRDYYFDTDEKSLAVQAAYRLYLKVTFRQFGLDEATATKKADGVFALEKRLAQSSRKLAALRDSYSNYNKMSLSELSKRTPALSWPLYWSAQGISSLDSVIIGQPEFFIALNKELTATPLDVWKDYLQFHLIRTNAPYLDASTFANYFEFSKAIGGVNQPKPRWKQVLDRQEQAMGEAMGQLFAKDFFNDKAKKRYTDLVENFRSACRERIARLSWMSDSTKERAYDKLEKMNQKVGYPKKWKDFSAMDIRQQAYVLNVQNANLWWTQYNNSKLGKSIDRDEWFITPQTYDAYYNTGLNEIVLPAAIFAVPGYLDEELDEAFAYGYAGRVIGHEISHGFDDQGRQFDASGNLRNWWTKIDEQEFTARTKAIVRQFNEFTPVDNLHVNGEATQGENIADLGGVLVSLDAFKKTEAYKSGKMIGGLTPIQRFFLGFAYGWAFHFRKEALANYLKTDTHAPPKERVNGALVNVPEFYEAFNISPADKMYRPDSLRVFIW